MFKEKKINMTLNRSGNGNITPRLTLPLDWVKDMGVTEDSREVTATYDSKLKKMVIYKDINDSEDTFIGEGVFHFRGENHQLDLILKIQQGMRYQLDGKTKNGLSLSSYPFKDEEMHSPILTKIILKNLKGETLSAEKIEDLFIASTAKENTLFTFIPRSGVFKFNSETYSEYHMIRLTNFDLKTTIGLQTKDVIIRNLPFNPNKENEIVIYNTLKEEVEEGLLNDIFLSLELLQGKPLTKISETKIGKERLIFSRGNGYSKKNCNSILSNYLYSNDFLDRLLLFLNSLEESNKKKWRRALKLLSCYQYLGNVEYLVRLFQFFDVFKADRSEIYKETLVREFNFSEKEATFIKKVRNDVLHEGLFIDESISKNIGELTNSDSILKKYFDRALGKESLIFGMYLQKVVTEYVKEKIFTIDGELVSKFGLPLFVNEKKIFKDFDYIFEQLCNY